MFAKRNLCITCFYEKYKNGTSFVSFSSYEEELKEFFEVYCELRQ